MNADNNAGCFYCKGCRVVDNNKVVTPDGYYAFYGFERKEQDGRYKRYRSNNVLRYCPACGRKMPEGGAEK